MLRPILLVVFLFFGVTMQSFAQDRAYGRSVVMTDRGIVATSHYLASQAEHKSLRKVEQRSTPPSPPMPCSELPSP